MRNSENLIFSTKGFGSAVLWSALTSALLWLVICTAILGIAQFIGMI